MKERRLVWWLGALVGVGVFAASGAARAEATASLTSGDCVKCHAGPPADVAAAGGKHQEVSCQDCHTGHRPSSKNNIPECSSCHEGKPHYELKDCLGCHRNPHTPLKIAVGKNVTAPCLTCHTAQADQLKEFKSKHSALFCSSCHDVHRKIPECVQCHKPHSAAMVQADCKKCHKAHKPTVVTYASTVPNQDCGACHAKAATLLSASATKHKALACVFCHKEKHKAVPPCQECHGQTPHPATMLVKFPKCGDCHNTAHDLNNWTAPAAAGAKAPGKAKGKP